MLRRFRRFIASVLNGSSAYAARFRLDAVIAFDRANLCDRRKAPWNVASDMGEFDASCSASLRQIRAKQRAIGR